jgi:hypothetical protein
MTCTSITGGQVMIVCDDNSKFSFPQVMMVCVTLDCIVMFYSQGDCVLLPIYHSSAEELAQYLFFEFIR